MTYQPAVGVWRESPERMMLWAVEQTIHRLTREIPERREVKARARKIRAALNGPVKEYDWEGAYDRLAKADVPDEIVRQWEEMLGPLIEETWRIAGEVRTTAEGLPFDEGELAAALSENFEQVKTIPASQRDRLAKLMARALEERTGQFSFARMMRQEWATLSKRQADLIAVTEWNRAASKATLLSYQRQGIEYKRWFNVGDDAVCDDCEDNAADGEIPIEDSFSDGSDAPPSHPGCRCNLSSA